MKKKDTLVKLKEKERQLRKDIIIEAAQKVFGEKTYDKASMQEIAEQAGMAKSSIYTYFPNQEALFVEAAYQGTMRFVNALEKDLFTNGKNPVAFVIHRFLDYYIAHEAHWRMITHFALFGNIGADSAKKLNVLAKKFMDLMDRVFKNMGYQNDSRLLAHTLFTSLSGILISFRKYPGRSEAERISHMKKIGHMVEQMMMGMIDKHSGSS